MAKRKAGAPGAHSATGVFPEVREAGRAGLWAPVERVTEGTPLSDFLK